MVTKTTQNVLYNHTRCIMTYNCNCENLVCLRTSGTEPPEVGRVCWKREVHIKAEKMVKLKTNISEGSYITVLLWNKWINIQCISCHNFLLTFTHRINIFSQRKECSNAELVSRQCGMAYPKYNFIHPQQTERHLWQAAQTSLQQHWHITFIFWNMNPSPSSIIFHK